MILGRAFALLFLQCGCQQSSHRLSPRLLFWGLRWQHLHLVFLTHEVSSGFGLGLASCSSSSGSNLARSVGTLSSVHPRESSTGVEESFWVPVVLPPILLIFLTKMTLIYTFCSFSGCS